MVQGTGPQRQILDGYQGKWMRFDSDTWLGGIFGCDVFRVSLEKDEVPEPKNVFSESLLPRNAFYYAKLPVTSVHRLARSPWLGSA